jgi:hypothetical protein
MRGGAFDDVSMFSIKLCVGSIESEDSIEVVVDDGGKVEFEGVLIGVFGQFESIEAGVSFGVGVVFAVLCGLDQEFIVVPAVAFEFPA